MLVNRESSLSIWTVYHGVKGMPHKFRALRSTVGEWGQTVQCDYIDSDELTPIRRELASRGLVCLPRMDDDDRTIVEVWL